MTGLLRREPRDRPTIESILRKGFIQKVAAWLERGLPRALQPGAISSAGSPRKKTVSHAPSPGPAPGPASGPNSVLTSREPGNLQSRGPSSSAKRSSLRASRRSWRSLGGTERSPGPAPPALPEPLQLQPGLAGLAYCSAGRQEFHENKQAARAFKHRDRREVQRGGGGAAEFQ